MTKQEKIAEWMETRPVLRFARNRQIVEITGDDRVPYFEEFADTWEREAPLRDAESRAELRTAARAAMAEKFHGLPSFIRGPYGYIFDKAIDYLNAGKDGDAENLIRYAPMMPDYSESQTATFSLVKKEFIAAIEALPN